MTLVTKSRRDASSASRPTMNSTMVGRSYARSTGVNRPARRLPALRRTGARTRARRPGVRDDGVALREPPFEELERERVLDQALDRALQRPRAVRRVPALLREQLLRRSVTSRSIRRSASRARSRASWSSTISASCSRVSGSNDDDLVDAIQELRPEAVAQLVRRADVRGHDDHGVAEVDRAALAVGQPPVVEHLQQDVEDLGVRLLDLVEQHDGVRAAAHGLGELPALLVADVAGRRADEPRRPCAAPGTRTCRAAPSRARRRT